MYKLRHYFEVLIIYLKLQKTNKNTCHGMYKLRYYFEVLIIYLKLQKTNKTTTEADVNVQILAANIYIYSSPGALSYKGGGGCCHDCVNHYNPNSLVRKLLLQ